MSEPSQRPGPDEPAAGADRGRRGVSATVERVFVAVAALVAGAVDARVVHDAGRTWASSLAAGAVMAVFVAAVLLWLRSLRRRFRGAPAADPTSTTSTTHSTDSTATGRPVGGWANPSAGQRMLARWRRLTNGSPSGPSGPSGPMTGTRRRRRR